jgi:methionyl-tRNA synthetase
MPETSDSEFREEELIRANNDVLIATWGNLANRVISMIHRNFGGVVPDAPQTSPESVHILDEARAAFEATGAEYNACHFRAALQGALALAQAANRYLDERAPWKAVKTDPDHAAETLRTALDVVNALKTLLNPVLPFSTARLHEDLGLDGSAGAAGWTFAPVPPGTSLGGPRPLYTKLDSLEEAVA